MNKSVSVARTPPPQNSMLAMMLNKKKKYVLGPDEEFVDYKYV